MANSIVFQNNPDQLRTSIYGFDGINYKAVKVNNNGAVNVVGTLTAVVGTITALGTINTISSVTSGTVKVTSISNGTVKATVSSITNGTVKVASITSITNGTVKVSSLTNGTVKATVSSITNGTVKLASTSGTIKVNLVDRTFASTTQTISVAATSSTYSTLKDISKYQETSWYLRNITASAIITAQLAVTPSTNLTNYPLALIQETATFISSPIVITNSYYLKYATVKLSNSSGTLQSVVVVFNGRY